jgi:hypothetical protein
MAFMMFEHEPLDTIVPLVLNNITNDSSTLNYIKTLVEYEKSASGIPRGIASKDMPANVVIGKLAKLNKLSSDAMSNSSFIEDVDRIVIDKFNSGELPKSESDLNFKGEEFKNFVVGMITDKEGQFNGKRDGVKMGRAKNLVLNAVYSGDVTNDANSIKNFLINNSKEWML